MLQDRLGVSERRTCRIVGQHRSTQRHRPQPAADEGALRTRLREISTDKPRWGYRRAHARLVDEGWAVNRKRVQRLWRQEGLRVPARKRKRRRLGDNSDGKRVRATRPDHVWALDFQADETADGRAIRLLNVVDEFTREALAMQCGRSIDAEATVACLERTIAERGTAPEHIRMDNGPELTANALRDWCELATVATAYIESGSPWQNPYVEAFNARVRDEVLDTELFTSLAEARLVIADWHHDYNHEHHHSALDMATPNRFAAAWRTRHPAPKPASGHSLRSPYGRTPRAAGQPLP
jgi:putative transposase